MPTTALQDYLHVIENTETQRVTKSPKLTQSRIGQTRLWNEVDQTPLFPIHLCPAVPMLLFKFFFAFITSPRTYFLFFLIVSLSPLECEIHEGRHSCLFCPLAYPKCPRIMPGMWRVLSGDVVPDWLTSKWVPLVLCPSLQGSWTDQTSTTRVGIW